MSDRVAGINALWKEAQLKPNANAQFGEEGQVLSAMES